jgi:PAS domain S-box-containing protein
VPLRAYLVSLTLATLLPVAIFAGIVGYFLVEEQRETFRRGAEERTLALLTAVDAELRGSIATIGALGLVQSLAEDDLDYFRETAQRLLASQPHWININLARPDRQRLVDLLAPEGAALPPITGDGELESLLQGRKPVISDLALGPVSKRWNFAVRAPVVRDGTVKYVLSAVVRPDAIARLVAAQNLPAGWVAVVLDRNNRIVARSVDPEKAQGQLASQSLREALASAPSGWFRGSTIEGTEVYTPYRRSEATGWVFAMGIPASTVDAVAWRGMGWLAVGLLGAMSLAIWLARVVGGRLATPIAELAKASEALGRGEAARVPEAARVDEVRLLARSFQGTIGALRASEERMRSVVDNVIDGIISIDERGIIQTFNPAAEKIFGYAAAEVFGQNVKMLMPEGYRREHDDYIANYVRTGQAKIIGSGREVEGRRKDGSTFPLDLAVSVFYIGSRRYFTGVVRDITERKRAEQALKDADRAKDEFLATMSHELRNPLAALTTAAHVLKVTDPSREAAIKARAVIERQTKHMARLIADLLDIGRVSAGKLSLESETLELAEVVSRLLQLWRGSGRFERHRVSRELVPVWVHADRSRVEQIAANLLDNALKFTPAGRTIAVSVRAEGDEAVFRVADQGVGLEPGERERVFDLFVQGGHGAAGMGIGLALVKRLVELQGGTVAAASEGAERGAVFTVRLPAVPRPQEQAAAASAPCGGARSVLLVEDNDDARQMLQAALALGGHEVRAAPDGESALALAAESSPDVALIDLGLPDISGYEVARRLRAAGGGRMTLIALTGYGQAADRRRALEAGFDAHLTKPVTPERLQQAIGGLR